MGFLQALFLAGTATFAIPVVIHLLFKTRKRRLIFSSLRFLEESLLRESRRLRLRDLLLLLLRGAACILIALAFARPYRHGQLLAGPGGVPREDLVIVLDDSPSMNAQEAATTRWSRVLDKAVALCRERRPGDRVGLTLASAPGRPEVEMSANFGAVAAALKRPRPSSLRGDLAAAFRTGLAMLGDSTAPRRRVVVLSDFQAAQVDRGAWAELAQHAAVAPRSAVVELAGPGGHAPARLPNLAITAVRAKSDVWIEGRPLPFAVRVENFSDGEVPNLALRLIHGDQVLAQRTVGLAPRAGAEVELAAAFPRPGEAQAQVEIDAHDVFPDDDRRCLALRLRDTVKAVVIEDRLRETDSFMDQSYYLRMALEPRARGGDTGEQLNRRPEVSSGAVSVTCSSVQLLTSPAAQRAADADIIFLVGVTSVPEEVVARLEETVRGGRSLVFFLGCVPTGADARGAPTALYEGPLWKGGSGLLPARPGGIYEGNLRAGKYDGLDAFAAQHPIFTPFTGELENELRRPKFLLHYRPDPADLKAGERPPGAVLASFNDGSPLLMERNFGKGRVLLFSFCPRPETTDLPKRKVFVPLIHQVVRYLAGVESSSRRNLIAGELLTPTEGGIPGEASVNLERPAPLSDILPIGGAESVNADAVGCYAASWQKGNLAEKAFWAVNLDPRESDLTPEDLSALQPLVASNLKESADPDAGLKLGPQSDQELKARAPDWRYFLVAALVCLLLEVLLRDFWER
jgi:hypothetical protein